MHVAFVGAAHRMWSRGGSEGRGTNQKGNVQHGQVAGYFAFWYSVGRTPLTLPVAHVQSKLDLFHIRNGSGTKC